MPTCSIIRAPGLGIGVVALRLSSAIDRRQALLGLMATAGTIASPARASALGVPAPEKSYAAFFLGQGGYWFSWGIPYLASQAQELGMETDVFEYSAVKEAWKKITQKKKDGCKIALVGYSLGNTTITWLQRYLAVDLLLAISESSLGQNHPIKRENTRRSVLWYGPDFLSNAGLQDGFDKINYVGNLHLMMNVDPRVVNGVLSELRDLVQWERDKELLTTASLGPMTRVARADGIAAVDAGPASGRDSGGDWPAMRLPLRGDVTCKECWGFPQSVHSDGASAF
jgi:hypothetical protein